MKLIKNIFKSIFILAGIAILAVLCCFAVMMFGKVSVFGYSYLNLETNEVAFLSVEEAQVSPTIDIEVNSKSVAVEILYNNELSQLNVAYYKRIQGICKDDVKDVTVEKSYTDGKLKIDITVEPSGLIVQNESKFIIQIPSAKVTTVNKVGIVSSTQNITISKDNPLTINELSLETTSKISTITVGEKVTITDKLYLKTTTGRINIDGKVNGIVNLDSQYGTFMFGQDVNANITLNGANPSLEIGDWFDDESAVNLNGELGVDCTDGGFVSISGNTKKSVVLSGGKTEFKAKNVEKGMTVADGISSIEIKNNLCEISKEDCNINANDGYVSIGNCYSNNFAFVSNKGDLTINALYGNGHIVSQRGKIDVTCADNTDSKTLYIHSEDASGNKTSSCINVKNIYGTVDLSTGSNIVTAEFTKVNKTNKIFSYQDVNVKVKDGQQFKLTTLSKPNGGNVNVSLGGEAEYNNWGDTTTSDGYRTRSCFVCSATDDTNSMTITSDNGNIKVSLL